MKLLVLGGSGFLGRNIIQPAAKSGWEIAATCWKSNSFEQFANRFGCEVIRHNLLDAPRAWDADVCIYLAGNSNHRLSATSPVEDLRLNAEAVIRFLEGFKGGLVFFSSAAVYDGHSGVVSPETPANPRMPYAISKLASEQYIRFNIARDRLAWATILRLYYAYGPHDRPGRLIPRLVEAVRQRQQTFTVTSPRDSLLDPLFSGDVAHAALRAAQGLAKGETFDLAGGHPRRVPDLVREALGILGVDMEIRIQPGQDETPVRFHSNPWSSRSRLHLRPFVPFDEGLKEYLEWTRSGA